MGFPQGAFYDKRRFLALKDPTGPQEKRLLTVLGAILAKFSRNIVEGYGGSGTKGTTWEAPNGPRFCHSGAQKWPLLASAWEVAVTDTGGVQT